MGTITLNDQQQRKLSILERASHGFLSVSDAAELLGRSTRQIQRMLRQYNQRGLACVVHGNSAKPSIFRTSDPVIEQIVSLAGEDGIYKDLNVCHMRDLLEEAQGLTISRSTLRRILIEHGVRKAATKRAVPRRMRERKSAEGMLLQIDGSLHFWLEKRASKFCLMGAIDDATGKVLFLLFRPTEDQIGYLTLIRTVAIEHGLPMAYYHDCHTMLRSPKKATLEDELAGREPMSQLQQVMDGLGIQSIAAHSPQAKGRIERLWQTLQDRLIKELRIAQCDSLEQANAFLPGFIARFNARFARPAKDPNSAWVPLPEGLDLDYYCSIKESRQVQQDNTISWQGQTFQLRPLSATASLSGKTVHVHKNHHEQILCYLGKERLGYKLVDKAQKAPRQTKKHADQPPAPAAGAAKQTARARSMAYLHSAR